MRCVQYPDYSHDIGMHAGQVVVVISRLHSSRSRSRSGSGTRRFVRDLAEELTPLVLCFGKVIDMFSTKTLGRCYLYICQFIQLILWNLKRMKGIVKFETIFKISLSFDLGYVLPRSQP